MAAGEAACASVHGANRLGANSLLDIVVFGRSASITTKDLFKPGEKVEPLKDSDGMESLAKLDHYRFSKGKYSTADIRKAMQETMQLHAAVFRIQETLEEGVRKMDDVWEMLPDVGI